MRFVDLFAVTLGVAVAAWAAGPARTTPARPAADALPGLPLEELPPQRLAKGQCGLFLWSRGSPARRILMALQEPAQARVQIGGRTVVLPLTARGGAETFGQSSRQTFAGHGVTVTLNLEVDPSHRLLGGIVVPNGTLDFRDANGWSVVAPVGGLIGCQGQDPPAAKGP